MGRYHIDLSKVPAGHTCPPLLASFADWLATQSHASVGYFDALLAEEITHHWDEDNAERLQKAAWSFLHLPDGSLVALLDTGVSGSPPAVVLLESEGEARTIAASLEGFLHKLADADTGVSDLDDSDASTGRPALKDWLKEKKVTTPSAPDFDFAAWLGR